MLKLTSKCKQRPAATLLILVCLCVALQTGDLGLDIGAQGEPLGYRQEGKSPPHLWLAGRLPGDTHEGARMSQIPEQLGCNRNICS